MLVYQRVTLPLRGSYWLRLKNATKQKGKGQNSQSLHPALSISVPLGQPTRTSKWQFAARSFNPTACVGGLVASSEPLKNGCIGKL